MSHPEGRRAPFKSLIAALAFGSMLSACIVAIDSDDDDWDADYGDGRVVSVRIDGGKRQDISCPRGYEAFIERVRGETEVFGCRKIDTDDDDNDY